MLKAVTRQASHVDAKISTINSSNASSGKPKISTAYFFDHYATKDDVAVMVTEEDFVNAERELVPSVSLKELEHYKRVRAQFEKPEEAPTSELNGKGKRRALPSTEPGIPDWQQQDSRPRSNGKGKGKAVDRKGKGKAMGTWDEEDDDEFYTGGGVNGNSKGKGKGKEVEGFRESSIDDDEELY
jgi:peroxin-6